MVFWSVLLTANSDSPHQTVYTTSCEVLRVGNVRNVCFDKFVSMFPLVFEFVFCFEMFGSESMQEGKEKNIMSTPQVVKNWINDLSMSKKQDNPTKQKMPRSFG